MGRCAWGLLCVMAGVLAGCDDGGGGLVVPPSNEDPAFDEEGSWQTRGGLPERLTGVAATVWNGHIYAVGGYAESADGSATAHFLRIEPTTLDVERLADFPTPIAETAIVALRDTLFVLGGNEGDRIDIVPSAAIFAYDDGNDEWISRGTIPDPRYKHTAHAARGSAYVIGGVAFTNPPGDSIIIFDGTTTVYGAPPNRSLATPVVGGMIGDTIFAMSSLFQSTIVRFDTEAEGWAQGLGAPFDGTATGGSLDDRFHAFGITRVAGHRIWDRSASAWISAPPPSDPVARAAVVGAAGRLVLIGGHDSQGVAINRLQAYDPPD